MRDLIDPTDVTYYRVDGRRLSPAELWNATRPNPASFLFVAGALYLGLFRLPNIIARTGRLHEADPAALPRAVRESLDRAAAAFEAAGFRRMLTVVEPVFDPDHFLANALFLDADRRRYGFAVAGRNPKPMAGRAVATRIQGGTVVGASDTRVVFRSHPESVRRDYPGVPLTELLDRHRELVAAKEAEGRLVEPYPADLAGFRAAILAQEARWFEYQVSRGVFVPLSEEEVARRRDRLAGS